MVALIEEIADVPKRFKVALVDWVKEPDPLNAVPTARVLLFASETPIIVISGIENIPVRDCELVSNVWRPVPEVNAPEPLLVIPP